jgi:integrase
MAKDRGHVQFYLKRPPDKRGKCLIYLQFKFYGKKLVYSFKQSIDPAEWSEAKQRSKKDHSLNKLLDTLAGIVNDAYKQELEQGIPEVGDLKRRLNDFMRRGQTGKVTFKELLDDFCAGKIERKRADSRGSLAMKSGTLANFHALQTRLNEYSAIHGEVTFSNINTGFGKSFRKFLERKGLKPNSIAKNILLLRAVMNYAHKARLTSNKFEYSYEGAAPSTFIYLTSEEIRRLRDYQCRNARQEIVRDRFIVSCKTGLAFADLSDLMPHKVFKQEGVTMIKIERRKTGVEAVIPLSDMALEILQRRVWRFPVIGNAGFNKALKKLCQDAGLNEIGRDNTSPEKPLWACVSSHTGRRTFCTNAFRSKFPVTEIMKISGHKTLDAFFSYIRHDKTTTAIDYAKHMADDD